MLWIFRCDIEYSLASLVSVFTYDFVCWSEVDVSTNLGEVLCGRSRTHPQGNRVTPQKVGGFGSHPWQVFGSNQRPACELVSPKRDGRLRVWAPGRFTRSSVSRFRVRVPACARQLGLSSAGHDEQAVPPPVEQVLPPPGEQVLPPPGQQIVADGEWDWRAARAAWEAGGKVGCRGAQCPHRSDLFFGERER